jgi:hypothetical protein
MNPYLNGKYTDEDVRSSESLYQTAVDFLKAYLGDWDFLVRAKNHLAHHGELPVPTARAVLNSMRSNPEGAMLLPQTPTGRYEGDMRHREERPRDRFKRPSHIDLPSVWHVKYVLSTWPTAQVYHVLRPEFSHIRWYPHTLQFGYEIVVVCGYPLGWSYNSTYIMTNDQMGRRICKGCKRRLEEEDEGGNVQETSCGRHGLDDRLDPR